MPISRSNLPRKKVARSLKQLDQWICFNNEKKPIDPKSGEPVDPLGDSPHQMSFPQAMEAYAEFEEPAGVGFVLKHDDDIVLVDLDDCLNSNLQFTDQDCKEVYQSINSYTEISFSGHGLHIIASGFNVGSNYGESTNNKSIEMYDARKFLTYTGDHVRGPEDIERCSQALKSVNKRFSPFESTKH